MTWSVDVLVLSRGSMYARLYSHCQWRLINVGIKYDAAVPAYTRRVHIVETTSNFAQNIGINVL